MSLATFQAWWDAAVAGSHASTLITIVLMALITVVSRSFFFI